MSDDETPDTYRIYEDGAGEWRWEIRSAGNHEVVHASTEGYKDRADCVANFERRQRAAVPADGKS